MSSCFSSTPTYIILATTYHYLRVLLVDELVASNRALLKIPEIPSSTCNGGGENVVVDVVDNGKLLLSTIRCEHISSGMWDDHLVVALPAPAYDNEL